MKHKDISNNDDASILAKAITSAADKVNSLQAHPSGAIYIPLDPDLKPDAKNGLVLGAPAYQSGGIAIMNDEGELEPFVDTRQINDDIKDANRNAQSAIDAAAQASQSAQQADSNATSAQQGASQAQKDANKAQQDATQALSTANSALTKTASVQQDATNALKNANSALARATHITTSPTAPSSPREQDIWYPTDSNNHVIGMKQYVGGRWQDVTLMASQILVPGSIGPTTIADGSITTSKLVTGAVTADKIAAGSITADKIKGNRLVGAQIQTNENAPYMLMTSQKFTVNPEKATTYNSGSIQFIGQNNALMGGLMFGNGDSPNNNMGQRDDYAAYLTVTNPKQSHNSNYANQIEIRDIDDPDGDNRRIDISSRYVSIGVNEGGNKYWRSYDFSKDGLSASYTDASGLFSERTSGYLSAHRTLFHNDNQPSAGVITLDDDITRYWKLEFEFKTNDGAYFGMPVYRPSVGKKFNASTLWYGFDNLPWVKTRAYRFTGNRTIDCIGENKNTYWRTGQQVLGRDWKVTPGDFISVTHVEGFFN